MTEMEREQVLKVSLCDCLGVLSDFHGQASLGKLRRQVEGKRRALPFVLWFIEALRKFNFGTFVAFTIVMFTFPKAWFGCEQTKVYVVSLTRNNARAFCRIRGLDPKLEAAFQENDKTISFWDRLRSMRGVWQTVKILRASGDTDSFVFLTQIMAATCLHLFVDDFAKARPKVVVTANDHSSPTVAVFSLARALGIRSGYIQHGPVTQSFPPLDYDLSVLLNQAARDSYSLAAQRRGKPTTDGSKICILSAFDELHVPIRMPQPLMTVCVALSYFSNTEKLQELVNSLLGNSHVSKVMISQHPRNTEDLSFLANSAVTVLPNGTTAQEIVRDADLCVVSNSGVALEYLHFGGPTFYINLEEETPHDYYGYVAAGVLPEFSDDVVGNIRQHMQFFDENWIGNVSNFDPTVGMAGKDLQMEAREKLLEFIDV